MGLGQDQVANTLGLEYARREAGRKTPVVLSKSEAPVKQVVKTGDEIDLREFPIVRHHYMDGGSYIGMTTVMRDPDTGAYNIAFLRTMYK